MNPAQLKNLLQLKGLGNKDTPAALEELLKEYPYFQSARMLLAKSLHEQQGADYDKAVKMAAAYTTERKALHELIEAPLPPEGGISEGTIDTEEFAETIND